MDQKYKVILIGERCIDEYKYLDVSRLNPEAPTQVGRIIDRSMTDGMAGNTYNNLVSLGLDTNNINFFSQEFDIIKTRLVDKKSGYILFRIDENDEIEEGFRFNSGDLLILEDLLKTGKNSYVVISDYNKGYLNKDMLERIFELCVKYQAISLMDTKKILGDWSRDCSFVKINNLEYRNNASIIKDRCVSKYCGTLLVTSGENGIDLISDGRLTNFPVEEKIEVRDVCGAGDSVLAGLVVKFIETNDLQESIRFANKVASFAVTKRGTYAVTQKDLEND